MPSRSWVTPGRWFSISPPTPVPRPLSRRSAPSVPRRILFGSDLPILRMRTRRICEDGTYVNLVPRGLYGDVSGDPHLREVDGKDADSLTFFMYEELDAFRRAALATGLSESDIEAVFHGNAAKLLCEAGMPESFLSDRRE